MRDKNSDAVAIKQKSVRAREAGLITRICKQCQTHLMIAQEIEYTVATAPRFFFFSGEFAHTVMDAASVQRIEVRLPPGSVFERFQLSHEIAQACHARRQLQNLFIVVVQSIRTSV